ncbi:hypothetical protein Leryth_003873 [Lithospermum erythrorhizon]|nr:hypothetical protein Leryth_003873 [Lithospermum erythrorhizon]
MFGRLDGIYIASVTKAGCLTVHDFDVLFCGYSKNIVGTKEDEGKQLLHIDVSQQLDVVRWNLANQDEVACTSTQSSEVKIFDIGYVSSEPVEVLQKKPSVTIHGCNVLKGLSDIAFPSNDSSRLFASDLHGAINMWDRRINHLPCLELTSSSSNALSSIKLTGDDQVIFGASKNGIIYSWDLRGGRSSAFQFNKEAFNSPMMSLKLASQLEKIEHLKAQSNIVSKEVHSIEINPSCPHQLAFHLDDGWSGVLDLYTWQVTHIHCPPPAWLENAADMSCASCSRKPSWLPSHSIYAVGSSSSNGLYLLDFYPDCSSPCHVDYDEHIQGISKIKRPSKQNSFIPLQEGITACTTHPLNGAIVAGTKLSSLLVVGQKSMSRGDEDEG